MTAGAHVVFGTRPAGRAVATALVAQGPQVRMVNRSELRRTYYQFDAPFVVDDSAFRDAFGGHTTNWHDIVTTTVDWYRASATTPDPANGLAEASTEKVTA